MTAEETLKLLLADIDVELSRDPWEWLDKDQVDCAVAGLSHARELVKEHLDAAGLRNSLD